LWMFDPHSIRRLKSFASMKPSADLVLIRLFCRRLQTFNCRANIWQERGEWRLATKTKEFSLVGCTNVGLFTLPCCQVGWSRAGSVRSCSYESKGSHPRAELEFTCEQNRAGGS